METYSATLFAWSQKTPEQQRQHVDKVLNIPLSSSSNQIQTTKRLLISVEDCGVTSVAAGFLNQMWHKVIDLGQGAYCVTEFGNCVKKDCILRRHPYFWKKMVEIDQDVILNLKEGHLKVLREALHLSV